MPDAAVSSDDFFYYLTLYSQTCVECPTPPDFTTTATPGVPGYGVPDGIVSAEDFFYFLALYVQGC